MVLKFRECIAENAQQRFQSRECRAEQRMQSKECRAKNA
jgi:hypothetical protein